MNDTLKYCVEALQKADVDKFKCIMTQSNKHEMNLQGTDFSLIRTTANNSLQITVIKDDRRGVISLNHLEPTAIDEAIQTVVEMAKTSNPDPDYDISPAQEPQRFQTGPEEADTERMYQLLKEYSQQVPQLFPQIKLMETTFEFTRSVEQLINSNGVDFVTTQGVYTLSSSFASQDGEKTSSFNYTGFALRDLERNLLDCASLKLLLQQSVEHLDARPLSGKFVGDVIITPECLGDIIYYYVATYLSDSALIADTSLLKDKLGEKVASEKLTLSSQPVSPEMAMGYFVTRDGFPAENVTVIAPGVLKSFLLSLYGATKTKRERAKNSGGCWVIEPGDKSLEEMIQSVQRGVLVARYSGGNPSANGDFSGVAKNSYYVENGKIMYPITETMISGNLLDIFKNIQNISAERVDSGYGQLPYLHTSGVTISGK